MMDGPVEILIYGLILLCFTSPLQSLFIVILLHHTIPLKEYVLDW
jgi:hypothetical protein